MSDYYTYAWLREDGTPYYIGKGRGRRAYLKRRWKPPTKDRILILKRNLTEEEAFRHEVYMIHLYGRKSQGGILHNLCDGGEGSSGAILTPETREKMSQVRRGKPLAWPESRPRYHSEELKKKMSEAHKGRKEVKTECPLCGKLLATQHIPRHQKGNQCIK